MNKTLADNPGIDGDLTELRPVKSALFTHSFWPSRRPPKTSFFKDCLALTGLCKPGKRVPSELFDHIDDMEMEGNVLGAKKIVHHPQDQEKVDTLKLEKRALVFEAADLEAALENKQNYMKKLAALEEKNNSLLLNINDVSSMLAVERNRLKANINDVQNEAEKLIRKIKLHSRKAPYFKNITLPDSNINIDIANNYQQTSALQAKLENLEQQLNGLNEKLSEIECVCQNRLAEYKKEMAVIDTEISYYQDCIANEDTIIKGRNHQDLQTLTSKGREKADLLKRLEYWLSYRSQMVG